MVQGVCGLSCVLPECFEVTGGKEYEVLPGKSVEVREFDIAMVVDAINRQKYSIFKKGTTDVTPHDIAQVQHLTPALSYLSFLCYCSFRFFSFL